MRCDGISMMQAQVAINSSYAALVLGVCVIVGFATGLDPQVRPVALLFQCCPFVAGYFLYHAMSVGPYASHAASYDYRLAVQSQDCIYATACR